MRIALARRMMRLPVMLSLVAAGFAGCGPKGVQSRSATTVKMYGNEVRKSEFDCLQQLAKDNGLDFKKLKDERTTISEGHVVGLDLSCTHMRDIRLLGSLKNLEELVLDFTRITNIRPLKELHKLKTLSLSYTKVSDISDLGELRSLTHLNLSKTPVSDIRALSSLKNLRILGLGYTRVRDLTPLRGLSHLRNLDLQGLPLASSEVDAFSDERGNLRFGPFLTLPEDSCSIPR
jgi:Leucine-rich repeat (LRR) protein